MRILKRLGLLLIAVCAFSAFAVSSASAAPLFLAHPAGGLLLASADNTQLFKTPAGTVECTKLATIPPDTQNNLRASLLLIGVQYSGCHAFGLKATVDPFRYIIHADGTVTIDSTVLILAEKECVVTVPATAANQHLGTITFDNNNPNGTVLLLANVTGITSSGTGGPSGICEFASNNIGTYTGNVLVSEHGGSISWMP